MLNNQVIAVRTTPRARQRGATLMESLVALVVLAFGVMGLLGLQLRTMTNNQNANHMATAARLSDNLFEAIKTNPNASQATNPIYDINDPLNAAQWAWLTNFAINWGSPNPVANPVIPDCRTAMCNPAELAAWNTRRWKETVRQSLPNGEAVVQLGSIPRQVVVIVGWRANEQAGTDNPTAFNLPAPVQVPAACGTTHTCYFAYGQP